MRQQFFHRLAFFYEEGKGGENYRKKKQVPLFGEARGEEAGKIQGNRLVSTILLYLILSYLKSREFSHVISPREIEPKHYRSQTFRLFSLIYCILLQLKFTYL